MQKDRFEIDVWAWGRGLESWLVEHIVVDGGPERAETWRALDDLLGRTWTHASGSTMRLARLAIDTGYETSAVYAWARRAGFAQVAPVKGVESFSRASPVSGPTFVDATDAGKRLRPGARLWTVSVSTRPRPTDSCGSIARPRRSATRAPRSRPLSEVVEITEGNSFSIIQRRNGKTTASVTADVDPEITTAVELVDALKREVMPAIAARHGIGYEFSGRDEIRRRSFSDLQQSMLIALALIYRSISSSPGCSAAGGARSR